LFLITFITAIPAFFVFYARVLHNPDYILGAGADNRVLLGAFLELILIIANIGTAVVLFPILKRQNWEFHLTRGDCAMIVSFRDHSA
jgi:hypothetical protein